MTMFTTCMISGICKCLVSDKVVSPCIYIRIDVYVYIYVDLRNLRILHTHVYHIIYIVYCKIYHISPQEMSHV